MILKRVADGWQTGRGQFLCRWGMRKVWPGLKASEIELAIYTKKPKHSQAVEMVIEDICDRDWCKCQARTVRVNDERSDFSGDAFLAVKDVPPVLLPLKAGAAFWVVAYEISYEPTKTR